jgi:hypothetical protein
MWGERSRVDPEGGRIRLGRASHVPPVIRYRTPRPRPRGCVQRPRRKLSPAVSSTPTASLPSPTPAPTSAPPTIAPTPSPTPTMEPSPTAAPRSPSPTAKPTMNMRAYFMLQDRRGGHSTLVPVLRTVPASSRSARAAVLALFSGPTALMKANLAAFSAGHAAGVEAAGSSGSGSTTPLGDREPRAGRQPTPTQPLLRVRP